VQGRHAISEFDNAMTVAKLRGARYVFVALALMATARRRGGAAP
jgi:hypothetical protein